MLDEDLVLASRARHSWESRLLAWANVVGVGIGRKETGGRSTGESAVLVYVARKMALRDLPPPHVLPSVLAVHGETGTSEDVPTDVIESGPVTALADAKTRIRPAPGGCSVGHCACGCAGTLGGLVRDRRGRVLLLSNNHVLALLNDARRGDRILQPAPFDGGTIDQDTLATLERFVPLKWGGKRENLVDAALARPRDEDLVGPGFVGLTGQKPALAAAALGTRVRKSGRTTGVTSRGEISDVDATFVVGYGPKGKVLFRNQTVIRSEKRFSDHGDSGSFILVQDDPLRVVGLLFAGNSPGTVTLANHMRTVLDELEVSLPEDADEAP